MGIPVQHSPLLKDGEFKVVEVKELNFCDISGVKSGTKGTSNKSYHIEHQVSIKNDGKSQIFTMWGATGAEPNEDWRHFDTEASSKKEFDRIIKSKLKKGYVEVDVAQRAFGSEDAKAIIKPVVYKNIETVSTLNISKIDTNVQRLIKRLFGATQDFVATTLKCPLGQLTNNQIDAGRAKLNEAKLVLNNSANLDKKELLKIQDITNNFYSLIPHNLGSGSRGKMEDLLLDDIKKIAQKEEDLDTLLDAKSVGLVMSKDSLIDDQYNSLNTDIEFIDHNDKLFDWIKNIVLDTRAHNHSYLGKILVHNAWKLNRHGENESFISVAESIAKECGKQNPHEKLEKFVKNRTDINDKVNDLYKKANVLPLFHGTRVANLLGIVKKSLLIRPSSAVLTGAMYGNGIYYGLSSKSINYTNIDVAYWSRGSEKLGYLFLVDVALGNQKLANGSSSYTKNNIKPFHSVWAKGGHSGVINDEYIVYDTNQHNIKYIIEFECQKN